MPEPFKNLFNVTLIEQLGGHLARVYPPFRRDAFVCAASERLHDLELKQRSQQITRALVQYLPTDFLAARSVLLACLHPEEDADLRELTLDARGVRGWAIMPMADFIAQRGGNDFDAAMDALMEMTKRFSAEFAVRPLINHNLPAALNHIRRWADSDNYHVRRLASEGARPRLPWGEQLRALVADPRPLLPVLYKLRDDPSDYVQRSVANHLNDIAKDHPQLLVTTLADWLVEAPAARRKLLRHACRTLIKQGDPSALALFGYTQAHVDVQAFVLTPLEVKIGANLGISLVLRGRGRKVQNLELDYRVYHRKANGAQSVKVFKWRRLSLAPGELVTLYKNHSFKPVTTRRYYPGGHRIAVQLNGRLIAEGEFELCE